MHIIDRRLNPRGKSLANRQRFLRRAKAHLMQSVRDSMRERSIKDVDQGSDVSIPIDGVREPRLHRSSDGGVKNHILPGNKQYIQGDKIPRPRGGAGSDRAGAGTDGEGADDFRFALSAGEFLDLFLEDLELPAMVKRKLASTESRSWRRAGYSVVGTPANLALVRTLRNSLARHAALGRPSSRKIRALTEEIEELEREYHDSDALQQKRRELKRLNLRALRVPFIDPIDVRYRRNEAFPKRIAQAVMFCLMDTSASMDEHRKDLAKRFFFLLHIFLKRRYSHVEIVFIRHTHHASEVDEDTFFNSTDTGGTVVSSALEEMTRVVAERYRPADWNIYAAQASDGDNSSDDSARTANLLEKHILPVCQYFAYVEVGGEEDTVPMGFRSDQSELWRSYDSLRKAGVQLAMCKVRQRREIYPVFRELFQRHAATTGVGSHDDTAA